MDYKMHFIKESLEQGRWINSEVYDKFYICSECGEYGYNTFKYCPNCGAKMIEPQDCRDCKEYEDCPCGKDGHESGTSQGYSIGECKDFEPQESEKYEPFINKPCISIGVCHEDKVKVLDEIRAEIEAIDTVKVKLGDGMNIVKSPQRIKDEALEIIDKYKAESEE